MRLLQSHTCIGGDIIIILSRTRECNFRCMDLLEQEKTSVFVRWLFLFRCCDLIDRNVKNSIFLWGVHYSVKGAAFLFCLWFIHQEFIIVQFVEMCVCFPQLIQSWGWATVHISFANITSSLWKFTIKLLEGSGHY